MQLAVVLNRVADLSKSQEAYASSLRKDLADILKQMDCFNVEVKNGGSGYHINARSRKEGIGTFSFTISPTNGRITLYRELPGTSFSFPDSLDKKTDFLAQIVGHMARLDWNFKNFLAERMGQSEPEFISD